MQNEGVFITATTVVTNSNGKLTIKAMQKCNVKVLFIIVTNVVIKGGKGHVKQRVSTQHEGVHYYCNQCSYKFKWKTDVKDHVEMQHEGFIYNSYQCNFKETRPSVYSSIDQHYTSLHTYFLSLFSPYLLTIVVVCLYHGSLISHVLIYITSFAGSHLHYC